MKTKLLLALARILVEAKNIKIEEVYEFSKDALALIPKTDALKGYANDDSKVEGRWVAKKDGKVVGLVTVENPSVHGLPYLRYTKYVQVIVSPAARNLGIGEKLLKAAFKGTHETPIYWAGFTHHSEGFKHLAKKFGIRDNDDVSRYEETSDNWQDDGSYEDGDD